MERDEAIKSLKSEIIGFISLKQEGGYWDFKRQWYEKKADLLHDIICMANNLKNRTAYILIGIDEENDCSIVDVKADPNRKNTQKIVDFLKDKRFAGGIRPVVHVEQVSLADTDIDVLVIENSSNTPFYLTEQFEGLRANHIYTRVMDTNTPKDKSADINHIEYLWRKRFHIDETPVQKFKYYLQEADDWESMQDCDFAYYYKYAPEYTIICESDVDRTGYEYYLFGQFNPKPSWWRITLKYYQTTIEWFLGIALDEGDSFVVAPERDYGKYNTGASSVGFYIQDDLRARLLRFFRIKIPTGEYSYQIYMKAVLQFQSEDERVGFVQYVEKNIEKYRFLHDNQDRNELPYFPDIKEYARDSFKKEYCEALVLQKMLTEYRKTQDVITEDKINADT